MSALVQIVIKPQQQEDLEFIYRLGLQKAKLNPNEVIDWRIRKRSLDARKASIKLNVQLEFWKVGEVREVAQAWRAKTVDPEKKVAIIGAGGIGFDVAEFLTNEESNTIPTFMEEWGVDMTMGARGGIEGVQAEVTASPREIYLLQRKKSKVGAKLGKTTGWIHRAGLAKKNVKMINGCSYQRIDDQGLHLEINDQQQTLAVDNIIVCAGQDPLTELVEGLEKPFHLIGGAETASELDAKTAIEQGTKIAASL